MRHEASGKVAGAYSVVLAFVSGVKCKTKRLLAYLNVDDDNSWHVTFEVEFQGAPTRKFDALSKAVRHYDSLDEEAPHA